MSSEHNLPVPLGETIKLFSRNERLNRRSVILVTPQEPIVIPKKPDPDVVIEKFVVKFHTKLRDDGTSLQDVQSERTIYEQASRYLPIAPTLFAYGEDVEGEKSILRIQKPYDRRLVDLSDEELRQRNISEQLIEICHGVDNLIEKEGWVPDVFGFPAEMKLKYLLDFPSIRYSTNIMTDEKDNLWIIDVYHPLLQKGTITRPVFSIFTRVKTRSLRNWLNNSQGATTG